MHLIQKKVKYVEKMQNQVGLKYDFSQIFSKVQACDFSISHFVYKSGLLFRADALRRSFKNIYNTFGNPRRPEIPQQLFRQFSGVFVVDSAEAPVDVMDFSQLRVRFFMQNEAGSTLMNNR